MVFGAVLIVTIIIVSIAVLLYYRHVERIRGDALDQRANFDWNEYLTAYSCDQGLTKSEFETLERLLSGLGDVFGTNASQLRPNDRFDVELKLRIVFLPDDTDDAVRGVFEDALATAAAKPELRREVNTVKDLLDAAVCEMKSLSMK